MVTSNIFTINITMDTATREPIERETIGSTEGTSHNIITTTITIVTIIVKTGTTSVIDTITSDTGAGVSEFTFANKRRIRA